MSTILEKRHRRYNRKYFEIFNCRICQVKPQHKRAIQAKMIVHRHPRSNIQIQREARVITRLQHPAQNRQAMRPRLLQDLRHRDRRLQDLRLRGLHHLKKALQVSRPAMSLQMLPNLKLEGTKDSEDGFFTG